MVTKKVSYSFCFFTSLITYFGNFSIKRLKICFQYSVKKGKKKKKLKIELTHRPWQVDRDTLKPPSMLCDFQTVCT